MRRMKKLFLFSCILLVFSCREKYTPNLNEPANSYLVVEGFINNGPGPTTITLTRSTKLEDLKTIVPEPKATVRVEGKQNTTAFMLVETAPGIYTHPHLSLNANDEYRLYIKTSAGKEYVSDYSAVRSTPDIDEVSWDRKDGGVQIHTSTHDASGKTKYYQYKYEETWEFHSKYTQTLKLRLGPTGKILGVGFKDSTTFGIDSAQLICWKTLNSTNISIASSEKLTQDVISKFPLVFIEQGSVKLSVLYSINVKQYAASQQGFRFLEQLKKNTEQMGTIFDAQPSDNTGNIHCLTNKDEIAIGFVEVSQEKTKRIFISNTQLSNWKYDSGCQPEIMVANIPLDLGVNAGGLTLTNVLIWSPTAGIDSVGFASQNCVDCRFTGSSKKPTFWP
jgi:hypothetical protein